MQLPPSYRQTVFLFVFVYVHWQVNRFIEVHFNSLETNLNLQTWVIVFEFFGIGAPSQPVASQLTSPAASSSASQSWDTSGNEQQAASNMDGEILVLFPSGLPDCGIVLNLALVCCQIVVLSPKRLHALKWNRLFHIIVLHKK